MPIHRATPADAERLAPLLDAYRVFYRQPSDTPAAEAFLRQRLTERQSIVFFAATDDGIPQGFTQLYPSFTSVGLRPILILNDLYVDAAFRRKRIAHALIDAAVQEGRSLHCRNLVLLTEHTNTPAQALYESLGWKRDTAYARYSFTL
jgi:ribosomal protein S18 acetylase RimI-like enzyme